MLVSHRHRFIAMKTQKTAGTTLEMYLQRFCLPDGAPEPPPRGGVASEAGIIGTRGGRAPGDPWYSHMPAAEVRALLGEATWDGYFKFCAVRHPLDREVSWFWYRLPAEEAAALAEAPMPALRARMQALLARQPLPDDSAIYTIGGHFALDHVLRHERLAEDLAALCDRLGLPYEPARIGRFKARFRRRPEPWQEYYTPAARDAALARHARECAWFGYG